MRVYCRSSCYGDVTTRQVLDPCLIFFAKQRNPDGPAALINAMTGWIHNPHRFGAIRHSLLADPAGCPACQPTPITGQCTDIEQRWILDEHRIGRPEFGMLAK